MTTFGLRFRPEARAELEAAAEWHEANAPGLANEFIADAARLASALRDFPTRFPFHRGDIRRAGMRQFPQLLLLHGCRRNH